MDECRLIDWEWPDASLVLSPSHVRSVDCAGSTDAEVALILLLIVGIGHRVVLSDAFKLFRRQYTRITRTDERTMPFIGLLGLDMALVEGVLALGRADEPCEALII